MQSSYVLEKFEMPDGRYREQISRFNEEGNRIVVIRVEAFDRKEELSFIVTALNKLVEELGYQSKGDFDIILL
jgi:hypothetical protein